MLARLRLLLPIGAKARHPTAGRTKSGGILMSSADTEHISERDDFDRGLRLRPGPEKRTSRTPSRPSKDRAGNPSGRASSQLFAQRSLASRLLDSSFGTREGCSVCNCLEHRVPRVHLVKVKY